MTDFVEMPFSADLVRVLDALGILWTEGRPANGHQATIVVTVDVHTDGRLEALVGDLSRLRWSYEPGRQLQLTLPGVL